MTVSVELEPLEQVVVEFGKREPNGPPPPPTHRRTPLLRALRRVGARHLYVESADSAEISTLSGSGGFPGELDGNTVDPLGVHPLLERVLKAGDPERWFRELESRREKLLDNELETSVYAIACGRLGNTMARTFGVGAPWKTGVQIHMGLVARPELMIRAGHLIREMIPRSLIQVPFTPDEPSCFLVVRDLERAGIPVALSSVFSARQVAAAAVLAGASRVTLGTGRLSDGLRTDLLGDHVALETQRILGELRRTKKVDTRLMVAGLHSWRTFERTAGCDGYAAPVGVIRSFLAQNEVTEGDLRSRLEITYEQDLQVPDAVRNHLGAAGIARLFRVEPEFVAFLETYRRSSEFMLADGEMLEKRFHEAGFGDVFHAPDASERREMERGEIPDLDGNLIRHVPIDTHLSLLANAELARHQAAMDALILERLGRGVRT